MKTQDSADILELLSSVMFGADSLGNHSNKFNIEYPPKQPTNPNFDIGSFKLIDKETGKGFVCAVTVREVE